MRSSHVRFERGRRGLRRIVLLLGFPVAAMACGGSPAATASPSPQASLKPESQLVMAGPAGAVGDTYQKLLNAWGAANGVTITYITGTSASSFAKIQAQAQAGQMQIDMINDNDQIAALGRAQGIWAPINKKVFTNLPDIDQTYAFPTDVMGNPPVSTRLFVILSGIAYNADLFARNGWPAPTSWLDLLNPMYAKCLAPLDPNQGVPWIPMLNYLTTKDWTNATVTFADLKKVAKDIPSYNNTNPSALALVAKGTACVTPTSQGRAIEAAATSPQIKFIVPKEGAPMYGGDLSITKQAPHPIAAQLAVNMLLGLDAGTQLLQSGYFASVNKKVTRPASGIASGIPVASEFSKQNIKPVPIATYDHTDDWLRQYQALATS